MWPGHDRVVMPHQDAVCFSFGAVWCFICLHLLWLACAANTLSQHTHPAALFLCSVWGILGGSRYVGSRQGQQQRCAGGTIIILGLFPCSTVVGIRNTSIPDTLCDNSGSSLTCSCYIAGVVLCISDLRVLGATHQWCTQSVCMWCTQPVWGTYLLCVF